MDWHRKRHPLDVPTPLAVAVADFCRRAKAAASPALVREALALLEDSDDFRVKALADAEPMGCLGPFAIVDIILGTEANVAELREKTGYYEMVRKVSDEAARLAPHPAASADSTLPAAPPLPSSALVADLPPAPAPAASPPPRSSLKKSVKERIAPHKREAAQSAAGAQVPPSLPSTAFLPKRILPAPRGRFTTLASSRSQFDSLFEPQSKEIVEGFIAQVPHRVGLLRTLEQSYLAQRGQTLSVGDVEDLLEHHELFELIEPKEREGVLAELVAQKGALGRAAHGLGLTLEELEKLIGALGISAEIEEIRARYVRDALCLENLPLRLDLLFRSHYLQDLGIEGEFHRGLKVQLKALIAAAVLEGEAAPKLVESLSRQHALHPEGLRRALERLGLIEPSLKDVR